MSNATESLTPHSSQHSVGLSESLASIAIRYNSTPSELAQLNKLTSHMVYPGQKLKVPSSDTLSELEPFKKPPSSPSLPIARTVRISSQFSSYENISLCKSPEDPRRYSLPTVSPSDELSHTLMRIRAKYMTQFRGCVHGRLHLTPQSIVFEPNSADQLVEDRGSNEFSVILSMQAISDLTVTSDFTKFVLCTQSSSPRSIPSPPTRKRGKEAPTKSSPREPGLFETTGPSELELCELPEISFTKSPVDDSTVSKNSRPLSDSEESDSTGDLIQPMFLRLATVQTPLDTLDAPTTSLFTRLIRSKPDTDSAIKRVKTREEYWFAIPHSRSDSLYAFIVQWNPQIKPGPGLAASDNDKSFCLNFKENYIDTDSTSTSWDMLPSLDTLREQDHRAAADAVPLPSLFGTASLLSRPLLRELNYLLPSRTVGHDLWLVYSSFVHGISLRTMYRNMEKCTGPVVFILRDDRQHLFGGVVSCPLRVSDHYYGTGESFVFRFEASSCKVSPYRWTGINTFFVKGDHDSISFGGGNGKPALWLDGDFYNGSSFPCSTFDNLQLSCNEDFLCTGFESWGFADWNS